MAAAKSGREAGSAFRVAHAVTAPPAEKPIMPMRSGETFHSAARWRTSFTAWTPSAVTSGFNGAVAATMASMFISRAMNTGTKSPPVASRRYLSTKAVTPSELSHRATSTPSFS